MARALLLAALAVTSAASLLHRNTTNIDANADSPSCRAGFRPYQGWCVYTTDPSEDYYTPAADACAQVAAFAPSIHSEKDVNFWSTFASYELSQSHFWLDAYCPAKGEKYVWRDGSDTDYAGPNDDFLNCEPSHSFHMQYNGLDKVPYARDPAPAVCVYDPAAAAKTTTVKTTPKPTTRATSAQSTTKIPSAPTTSSPQFNDYCTCNTSSIYLDIVFVLDTSGQMAKTQVDQATSTIQSTLRELALGTDSFHSNVAAIAYAESVQTVAKFGDLKSTKDIGDLHFPYLGGSSTKTAHVIEQASSMIASNARNFTRGVIVLLTNSISNLDAINIVKAATDFKNGGGILITIDYSYSGIGGLENIASSGYYIKDASADLTLSSNMLYSFCDANCFCRDVLVPYNVPNSRGRDLPNGCYHVADSIETYSVAAQNCALEGAFVATIHDDAKSFFMTSLFPMKTAYWIGLERNAKNGKMFDWADGSKDAYTNWAPANPVDGLDCVYGRQLTGFNSPWYSAPCADAFKNSLAYACQLLPCSSDYDCYA